MQREKTLLQANGLFTVNSEVLSLNDIGILETMEDNSVIVISYSDKFEHYQEVIDRGKRNSIPVIVLALPGEIKDHMGIFKAYPYFEMCNTSARLLTTIFNLCAVTPNAKK